MRITFIASLPGGGLVLGRGTPDDFRQTPAARYVTKTPRTTKKSRKAKTKSK